MLFSGKGKQKVLGRVNGARPIAVDFGVRALKILQVGPGDPPALVAAVAQPTPDEYLFNTSKRLEFQLEQLPMLIEKGGFKGRRVACLIPSSSTFCKHMQVALGEGVNVQAVLESAIPAELNCPAEALIIRSHEVSLAPKNASGKTELICLATPRELVRRIVQSLTSAKLEVVGLHPELLALLRAFSGVGLAESEPTMYIDLGWSATRVVIAHGADIVFARAIDLGGRQLDEVVRDRLGFNLEKAGEYRRSLETLISDVPPPASATGIAALDAATDSGGGTATAQAAGGVDLAEPLEMLTDEISMSLRYHASVFPNCAVTRAVFVGGEARHGALCEHIARVVRLPGHAADPMARVARTGKEPLRGIDFKSARPGWTAVLGACLSPTDL